MTPEQRMQMLINFIAYQNGVLVYQGQQRNVVAFAKTLQQIEHAIRQWHQARAESFPVLVDPENDDDL